MSINQGLQQRRIIERRVAIGLDRHGVAELGGIAEAALAQIEDGERLATVPELICIAHATGSSVGYLTGQSDLLRRVQMAARAEAGADTSAVKDHLGYLLEMDDLLDSILEDAA